MSFTLRTKLLIIVAVPMLLLGSITALAALQAKSFGDDAAERVESVDQALAIERLADALRTELAATLDPDGTPKGLREARSATDILWVRVFDFMNEADRARLDTNQAELLRLRQGFGVDPAVAQDILSAENLGRAPEVPGTLLGAEPFHALVIETARLDRLQVEAYPDVEIALDMAVLKNLVVWQDALVAEKLAFDVYLHPEIADAVKRLGLLGPTTAATGAQNQFLGLTPVSRRAIADRLAANSAALVLERARVITRSGSVEARSSLQMSSVTAASDALVSAIAAEHRTLERGVIEATNTHLSDARELQRNVLLGGVGSLMLIAMITLFLSRSIIRDLKWLELRSREPRTSVIPSSASHGAMPTESAKPAEESKSMSPARLLASGTALASAADRPDQTVADSAIAAAPLVALDSVPESLRAPAHRDRTVGAMPILPNAVPASAEVERFDPTAVPAVPDALSEDSVMLEDSAVSEDNAGSDESRESEDFAVSDESRESEDFAVSDESRESEDFEKPDVFSVPARLRRQLLGSGSPQEMEPPPERVTADQFAAEFAAAGSHVTVLPETVVFADARPRRTLAEQDETLSDTSVDAETDSLALAEQDEAPSDTSVDADEPTLAELDEAPSDTSVDADEPTLAELDEALSDTSVDADEPTLAELDEALSDTSDDADEPTLAEQDEAPSEISVDVDAPSLAELDEAPSDTSVDADEPTLAELDEALSDTSVDTDTDSPTLPQHRAQPPQATVPADLPSEPPHYRLGGPSNFDPQQDTSQPPASQETIASSILTIGAAFAAFERRSKAELESRSKPYDQEAFPEDYEFQPLTGENADGYEVLRATKV